MDSKIDMHYLNTLSLFDLYEMAEFYDLLLNADWSNWKNEPKFDRDLCEERSKLLSLAIRVRKCSIDERLFGTPTILNTDDFIDRDSLTNSQKTI
jgi:hypothetical protein